MGIGEALCGRTARPAALHRPSHCLSCIVHQPPRLPGPAGIAGHRLRCRYSTPTAPAGACWNGDPTRLSHSRGSLSAAVRARRRAEVASTRAPTEPVEGLWRELAGAAPTLGIGGDPPALTAGSSGDARQVRRQDPGKSRANRVHTRTLVDSHVGINDSSVYACMLAIPYGTY